MNQDQKQMPPTGHVEQAELQRTHTDSHDDTDQVDPPIAKTHSQASRYSGAESAMYASYGGSKHTGRTGSKAGHSYYSYSNASGEYSDDDYTAYSKSTAGGPRSHSPAPSKKSRGASASQGGAYSYYSASVAPSVMSTVTVNMKVGNGQYMD